MTDIFLSYAREDHARAETIARALTAAGHDVFWDVEIPPGKSWADILEERLARCKAVVVLWSTDSTKSKWVREEARLAREQGKLLPILIDEAVAPFGFGEIQSADLKHWDGDTDNPQWRLLLKAIDAVAASPGPSTFGPTPAPAPSPKPRRRWLRWLRLPRFRFSLRTLGITFAVIVVAICGAILLTREQPAATVIQGDTARDEVSSDTMGRPSDGPQQQNYGQELTDFGVPPQSALRRDIASETPTSIPGAQVFTTARVRDYQDQLILIDVLPGDHETIEGALKMPGMGDYGNFNDNIQKALGWKLMIATKRDRNRPVVFFCAGARCWESYNAALRAVSLGYKRVGWYRGGVNAWRDAGLPLE